MNRNILQRINEKLKKSGMKKGRCIFLGRYEYNRFLLECSYTKASDNDISPKKYLGFPVYRVQAERLCEVS